MLLEYGQLTKLAKLNSSKDREYVDALNPALLRFEINTPARISACLAQFAHETMGFKTLRELGPPSYFSKYDFRRDLGNYKSGMGYLYCGRGFIQITGLTNYLMAEKALGLPLVKSPHLVEQPETGAIVSCWWWQQHKLNECADRETLDSFKQMTRIINGGFRGLSERIGYWGTAKTIWK